MRIYCLKLSLNKKLNKSEEYSAHLLLQGRVLSIESPTPLYAVNHHWFVPLSIYLQRYILLLFFHITCNVAKLLRLGHSLAESAEYSLKKRDRSIQSDLSVGVLFFIHLGNQWYVKEFNWSETVNKRYFKLVDGQDMNCFILVFWKAKSCLWLVEWVGSALKSRSHLVRLRRTL